MAIIREEFPTRRFWKSAPFIQARNTLFPNFQYHRIPKQGLPNWYPSRQAVPGDHWPPNKGCTDRDILKLKGSHHRNRRSRVYRILQLFVVSVILWQTGQEQTSRTTKDFSVHMPGTFLSPCPMPLPATASWTHHPHLSQDCQLDRLSTRAATYVPWIWTRNGMAQHLSPLIENAKQGARDGALWYLLHFQKINVQSLVSTLGRLQLPATQPQRIQHPLLASAGSPMHACGFHTQIKINLILKVQNKVFRNIITCLHMNKQFCRTVHAKSVLGFQIGEPCSDFFSIN